MARPKILYLLPDQSDFATIATKQNFMWYMPVLVSLGYDVQAYNRSAVPHDDWDACIVPQMSVGNMDANITDYINCVKPYPVFFMRSERVDNGTTLLTGIESRADYVSGDANLFYATTIYGDKIVYQNCYTNFVLKADTTGWTTEIIATLDATESPIIWKRTRSVAAGGGGSFVLHNNSEYIQLAALMYFLKEANLPAPNPWILYLDLDDVTGNIATYGETTGYEIGLQAYIDWLEANNTMALGGLMNSDIGVMSPTLLALIKDNQNGVLPLILHEHDRTIWRIDDAPYDTVPNKLTAYNAAIAEWAAVGIDVLQHYNGYAYLPNNTSTYMGRQALAALGVKRLRISSNRAYPLRGELKEWITYDGTDYMIKNVDGPGGADYTTWSAYWGAIGAATEIEALLLFQRGPMVNWIAKRIQHYFCHPPALAVTGDSAEDTPFIKYLEKVVMPFVRMGSPDVIRLATPEDWENIAE